MQNSEFANCIIIIKCKISYISNKKLNKHNVKNVVFLFSPGASDASYYSSLFKSLNNKYTFISINYPGRGSSSVIKNNSINQIGYYCSGFINTFCNKYGVKNYYLFGLSFGATILIESIKYLNIKAIKKVVIVNGVEFFNSPSKLFFKLILIPCLLSKNTRLIYKYIFTKVFVVFEEFGEGDLLSITKQIYSIVSYKFKPSKDYTKIPAVFINSKKDEIILVKHTKLLKKTFKNGQFIRLNLKTHRISKPRLIKIFNNIFFN